MVRTWKSKCWVYGCAERKNCGDWNQLVWSEVWGGLLTWWCWKICSIKWCITKELDIENVWNDLVGDVKDDIVFTCPERMHRLVTDGKGISSWKMTVKSVSGVCVRGTQVLLVRLERMIKLLICLIFYLSQFSVHCSTLEYGTRILLTLAHVRNIGYGECVNKPWVTCSFSVLSAVKLSYCSCLFDAFRFHYEKCRWWLSHERDGAVNN